MATEVTGNPHSVSFYEGLIFVTTKRIEQYVELEPDDISQRLRIKVWRALERYDRKRSKMPIDRWVFQCLANEVKDILKKRREYNLHIEDFTGQTYTNNRAAHTGEGGDGPYNADSTKFTGRYLSVVEEDAFEEVLTDPNEPALPGLTPEEQTVAGLLIENFTQPEIAIELGIRLGQVRAYIAAIKLKLAEANPDLSRFIEADELVVAA